MKSNIVKLYISDIINRFGDGIDTIALSYIMYEVSGSASLMSLVIGINYLPTVFLAPIISVFVERVNKKRIMVLSDLVRALLMITLIYLYVNKFLTVGLLITFTLMVSVAECFRTPATNPFIMNLIDAKKVESFIGRLSALKMAANISGLAVSGFIIFWLGNTGALIIDMLTFVISALIILSIRYHEEIKEKISNFIEYKNDFVKGLKYIRTKEGIMVICFIAVFLNLAFVPINTTFPAYNIEVLKQEAYFLSFMEVAITLGNIIGSVFSHKIKTVFSKMFTFTTLIVGGCYMVLPIVGMFMVNELGLVLIIIALFVMGLALGVLNTKTMANFMRIVDKKYLARTSSIFSSLVVCANPVGAFLVSFFLKYMGINQVFIIFLVVFMMAIIIFNLNKNFKTVLQDFNEVA